jgi:hypothetical protein
MFITNTKWVNYIFLVVHFWYALSHHVAAQMLLFATSKDIRIANLSRPLKPVTIIKDLEEGAAIDYYYKKSMVCWTDHGTEMISCCTFDGNNVGSKHNVSEWKFVFSTLIFSEATLQVSKGGSKDVYPVTY